MFVLIQLFSQFLAWNHCSWTTYHDSPGSKYLQAHCHIPASLCITWLDKLGFKPMKKYNSTNLGIRISQWRIHFGIRGPFCFLSLRSQNIWISLYVGLSLNDIHPFSHLLEKKLGSNPTSIWVLLPTQLLGVGSWGSYCTSLYLSFLNYLSERLIKNYCENWVRCHMSNNWYGVWHMWFLFFFFYLPYSHRLLSPFFPNNLYISLLMWV